MPTFDGMVLHKLFLDLAVIFRNVGKRLRRLTWKGGADDDFSIEEQLLFGKL